MREKVKGRKLHIVVYVMGNLLSVVVHAANIHDTKSDIFAAKKAIQKDPSIQRFCTGAGYRDSFEKDVENQLKRGADISTRTKSDWDIIPKRWVVERTFSWVNNSTRLSKDHEISLLFAQSMCMIAVFRTLISRF